MIPITEKEFTQLSEFIQENYGICLKSEKKTLVMGRLTNVLAEKKFRNYSEYFAYLQADKTGFAAKTLINRITTNHTYFMREEDHFHFFQDKVLPYLERSVKGNDLRIWSAGCSSGEEPYTLAMILNDYFKKENGLWDTKVLATDISDNILEKAKRGRYSGEQISSLPPEWRVNYFKKQQNGDFTVNDALRNDIIFRKFNLMDTFPFKKKFHVIFCRNVMIYFDERTKTDLINRMYEFMETGGYLFVGHSESLNRDQTKFKYVLPAVYRKE